MSSIGANITIYCDLYKESLTSLLWRRSNYDGSNNLNLLPTIIPSRYNISSSNIDSVNSVSLLTITGVILEDFATFECSANSKAQVNLTEARN